MLKYSFFLISALICSLIMSCGNSPTQQPKDMTTFVEDEEFKNAHEIPDTTTTNLAGNMVELPSADGKVASVYWVKPMKASDRFLLVIHEWWGLNDHIKAEADRYAAALPDVNVIALDMYDGQVADNPDDASRFMKSVSEERAEAIINAAITFAGEDARIGTIGWCFGGGWSLKASLLLEKQAKACVIYYGMPVKDAKKIAKLETDVLGIFAKNDAWITPEVAKDFKAVMKATGKKLYLHSFDADHAFANPSSPRYEEKAATEANEITLEYLRKRL